MENNKFFFQRYGLAEQDLERYARTASPGIRDDGRRKVMAGETTLEEVLRVTRED